MTVQYSTVQWAILGYTEVMSATVHIKVMWSTAVHITLQVMLTQRTVGWPGFLATSSHLPGDFLESSWGLPPPGQCAQASSKLPHSRLYTTLRFGFVQQNVSTQLLYCSRMPLHNCSGAVSDNEPGEGRDNMLKRLALTTLLTCTSVVVWNFWIRTMLRASVCTSGIVKPAYHNQSVAVWDLIGHT